MRVIDRLAESEDPVLYASYGEADKCKFIKVNALEGAWEAWSSTDDGAGLLVKADALRKQAREVLVSATCCRTYSVPQPATWAHCLFLLASTPLAPAPPLRPPQGQEVRLAENKEPAAMKGFAAMKESAAAVKEETTQANCRCLHFPAFPLTRPRTLHACPHRASCALYIVIIGTTQRVHLPSASPFAGTVKCCGDRPRH